MTNIFFEIWPKVAIPKVGNSITKTLRNGFSIDGRQTVYTVQDDKFCTFTSCILW